MSMKRALLFAVIVLIGFVVFGCIQPQKQAIFSEKDARTFVNDDLNSKFSDAEIKEITEITLSPTNDSWQIKARVTFNYSSPCPIRMNVYYDYPRKGFIATPPEYVTRDCFVCRNTATCIIGTPEEAIIASHTMNNSVSVNNYITAHLNAVPDAKFYTEYVDTDNNTRHKDVWLVKWLSPTTNFGILTLIADNGEIIKSWEVARSEFV